jgi:hypothetical protein
MNSEMGLWFMVMWLCGYVVYEFGIYISFLEIKIINFISVPL